MGYLIACTAALGAALSTAAAQVPPVRPIGEPVASTPRDSLMSAVILPLATTYNVCEGLGFEAGISRRFREAPVFYGLYTGLIVFGAGFVLIPHLPLLQVILVSQVANGILLPFVLTFMLLLVNRKSLMGEYRNSILANVIAGGTSVVIIALTGVLIWTTLKT